ncbi:MAG TPA: thiol reductant ABC exporter subunit CydC [Streptosporangiaceae bacterium]
MGLAGPERGRLAGAALAGAAATGCGVALLAVSGFLLARASQHPSIVAISVAVVAVRGLSVGRAVFRYLERLGTHDTAFRVLARVRVAIYRRLERLAPAGLGAFRSGDLLARLVSDVDATQDLFIRGLAPPLAAVLVGAAASAAMLAILAPAAGVLAAGLIVAGVAVPWLCARTAALAARRTAPVRGELGAALTDALAGSSELIAFGAERAALDRVTAADAELTRLARRTAGASGLGTGFSSLLAGATLWAVLLLGVAATGGGTLGRVPLAVITLTALAAFEAVTVLPAAAIQLGQSRASAARIGAVLDAPDPVAEPAAPAPVPAGPVAIGLREISVRYRPDGPPALDGFDLDLRPGRRVVLLGPTGSGKSTVAAVLLRFADPSGGTATLNGAALGGYSGDDVRRVVRGLAQDAHVFDTTIRANLLIGAPQAGDAELAGALARVALDGWLATLPLGLDTPVGAHGAALSGGQRQRLALARALLSAPPVLVLDEPVAHLDPAGRRRLTTALLAPDTDRATLLITHDLAGLEHADEIIVLSDGRVAERGSHAGLLAARGWYRRMRHSAGLG